jgi:hypothetical protein
MTTAIYTAVEVHRVADRRTGVILLNELVIDSYGTHQQASQKLP